MDRRACANWVVKQPKPHELLIKVCDRSSRRSATSKAIVAAEAINSIRPMARWRPEFARSAGHNDQEPATTRWAASFRQNVRDVDKQHMLEGDRVVQADPGVLDRLIDTAEQELKARPDDIPTRESSAALMQRATRSDEERAWPAHDRESSNQFRFRDWPATSASSRPKRNVANTKRAAENARTDGDAARSKQRRAQGRVEELQLRVEAYPTDIGRMSCDGVVQGRTIRGCDSLFQEAGDPRQLTELRQASPSVSIASSGSMKRSTYRTAAVPAWWPIQAWISSTA